MKAIALPLAALLTIAATAQDLPQPSPLGKVEQVVGLTNVSVTYSRPSAKGRTIFGELVPMDAVWRTGANKATLFTTDGTIMIDGQKLEKGEYSLFTIPHKETWEIIFNKNMELWGEDDRKEEEDVLRVKAPTAKCNDTETFTIEIADVKDDKASLVLRWANTEVRLPIEAPATEQGIANIQKALAEPDVKSGGYNGAARFALDRNVMTKEALEWATKSVAMEKKFYNVHTLARAQAANGMNKEATATAEESMKLAQEAKNEAYVKMNRELMEKTMSGQGGK
ncbi:MAG: DUF2911 domain-containing protein [Flavobacteriales bacterium]|nr:DUF2911 domain-containing protein [Flavobacteriales bacterium]